MRSTKSNTTDMFGNFSGKALCSIFTGRRVLSSLVAAAVMVTSAVPASADSYFFRYRHPASWMPGADPTNPTDPQLGVGNDITIFFTGAIGVPFSKLIPVKTKDVVEWRFQTGALQDGLGLDPSTGIVSGTPAGKTTQKKAILVGYDVGGRMIARASITSQFHNPAGQTTDFTFYGHTSKYMYRQIPATVPIANWESIGDLPDDFHTEGRYFAGTPSKEYTTGVGFIGYDYMGKEVAFTYGDLIVQDTPVIEHIADQIRHPAKSFVVTPTLQYKIGEVKYRVIGLDGMPKTFGFNTKTGRLAGTIPTFNTSLRFRIEVTDIDGVVGSSNVFTLTTASPDVEMAKMGDQTGTVNKPYSLQITGKDLSGDINWKVLSGQLPDGISLDPETGEISGYPTRVETQVGIVIGAVTSDGGSGQTPAFDFAIYPEEIGVEFQPVETRVGRQFVTAGPTMGAGVKPPFSFDLAAGTVLDDAISIDFETVVVSGTADTSGDYSVPFDFTNGDGRQKTFVQPITIHDLLSIAYEPEIVVYRRTPASVAPSSVSGVIGSGSYKLASGALPAGLTVDPASGAIVGTPEAMGTSVDLSVSLADESGESAASNDFEIEVQDRPPVEVAAGAMQIERFVDNAVTTATAQNVYDGVSYELVAGSLPNGLSFDEDGVIRGNTTDLEGEYGGLQVQATDGEGYMGLSPVFSITVIEPKSLAPLNPANGTSDVAATWVEDTRFAFDLPVPVNAFGTVSYQFQNLPDGIAVVGGQLVGTVAEPGIYLMPFTLIDDARRTLSGNFTLTILEPMSATLQGRGKSGDEETDDVSFELPRGGDTLIAPSVQDAIGNVTYTYQGTLPLGLTYSDGKITGKPETQDQTGEFILVLTDEAGSVVNLHAKIVIAERVPLTLSYAVPSPAGYVDANISPLKPTVVDAIGAVTYLAKGALPPGIGFDQTTGYFYGVPTKADWFQGIEVTATDSEGPSYAGTFGPFAMGISMKGNPAMPATTTFTVRAGEPFDRTIDVANVIKPVIFGTPTGAPLPYGLTLGQFDGKISGTFPAVGKYTAGAVTAIDSFSREKTTTVKFSAVGPLEIAAPTNTSFNQYSSVSAQAVATNVIGAARYELVSGSLPSFLSVDPNTGTITGSADAMGVWSGLVLRVTDSTGSQATTEAFSVTIGDRLPLQMETADTYSVVANTSYKLQMPVVNAVGAVTFVQTGALPQGVGFDAKSGRFSGVATTIGSFPVTVTVSDSVGASVTRTFSLVSDTNGKPINLAVTSFVTKVGEPISTAVPTYSNHVGSVQFWADDTLADYGLTIDPATGMISGIATQLMDFTPNVNISDESLRVTSKPISIKVVPDLVANVPARIDLPVNKRIYPYIYVTADNGIGTLDWSIEGTLPKGVNFSTKNRRFTGTPTEMGTFPIKLTVAERDGFKQTSTVSVDLVVVSDGIAPGVSISTVAAGYYTHSNFSITPTYKNPKTGDVLTLAPDSAPLPPGFTFKQNSVGRYYLSHAAGAVTDQGIHAGIKLRVTAADGLYGDSEFFTIILKNGFNYPSVQKQTVRAYEPVAVQAPAPTSGAPTGSVTYSFYSDFSNGTLKIDPATGLITGYVTRSGTVGVRVIDSYNGATLRSAAYTVPFTALVVSVATTPARQVTFTGISYPNNYVTTVTNGAPDAVMSLSGITPPGLSIDPATGSVVGTATAAGVYPVQLVYTDDNQTLDTPFTINVEQAAEAGKGYKFLRVAVTNKSDHLSDLVIRSSGGDSIMHLVSKSNGNLSDATYNQLVGKHSVINFSAGGYQDFELPVHMTRGSIESKGHGSATVVYSASVDGQTWDELGTLVNSEKPSATFEFRGEQGPIFAFNNARLTNGMEKIAYSFDLKTLVDESSLEGISASSLSWTWDVDPDRDTSTTSPDLPAGLAISGSTLRGTPTVVGSYAVILTGAYGGKQVSKAFSLDIDPLAASIELQGFALETGERWVTPYAVDLKPFVTANGMPVSELTWTASSIVTLEEGEAAGLPVGLSVDKATGVISGTPSSVGRYRFAINVAWKTLTSTSAVYTVEVTGTDTTYKFTQISAGDAHTCGVTTSGTIACWGQGQHGKLGNNAALDTKSPVDVAGTDPSVKAVEVNAGTRHSCALMENGSVKCWGSNSWGQTATTTNPYATDVTTLATGVTDIAIKYSHSCEVVSGGAKCHGWNFDSDTGVNSSEYYVYTPMPVINTTSGVKSVSVGSGFGCALMTTGAVRCWGLRTNGRLGNGSTATTGTRTPVAVTGLTSGVKALASGGDFSCVITSAGGVKCWGNNTYGQIGNNTTTQATTPADVNGLTSGVKEIALGTAHACALTNAGAVKCWGHNQYGKLGTGNTLNSSVPVEVVGLGAGVATITAGGGHTCALTTEGDYKCWGLNTAGQLGNGTLVNRNAP